MIKTTALLLFALTLPLAAQVRVNEVMTGTPDFAEIANHGGVAVDISGWSLVLCDDPTVVTVYSFPIPTILNPGEIVVVSESATSPTVPSGVRRFTTDTNINWAAASGGICALNNAQGAGVDRILFGNATNIPTQAATSPFTGSVPSGGGSNSGDSLQRNSMADTNLATDWTMSASTAQTPGSWNAGQTAPASAAPVAVAGVVTVNPVAGMPVQFIDLSTGRPTAWAWDFNNDGSVESTIAHPVATFATAGAKTVKLTVTNAQGSSSIVFTNLLTVGTPVSASLPYSETFTGPSLGAEWTITRSNGVGRTQLATDGVASPLSGGNGLFMDEFYVGTQGAFATNIATLRIQAAGAPVMRLRFYVRETGDEDQAEDGVYLSDGTTTVTITNLAGSFASWTEFDVDLAAIAATNGLNTSGDIFVSFRQRDDLSAPSDGIIYDDVRIDVPIPDTGQANSAIASLTMPGAVDQNAFAAANGLNGPFFASGSTAEFHVTGQPNQPYILLAGPLNRANYTFPFGQLDIGNFGSSFSFGDVSIVVNGLGNGFFDPLARTDAAGESVLSFGVGFLPPGVLGTFQALVYNTTASVVALTAAIEFTVTP